MVVTLARSSRYRSVVGVALALGVLGAMPVTGVAGASTGGRSDHHHRICPAAESLVPGTTFHRRTLAKGVTVSAGIAHDSRGTIDIHVLRVDLSEPSVTVKPLVHSVAERLPLSALAAGQPRLVAATNTGYFDFNSGAPTDPLIVGGSPDVISGIHQPVVGIGPSGRIQSGSVWLASTVTAGTSSFGLTSLNETDPSTGLGIYNSRWGSRRIPGSWSAVTRRVVGGVVAPGVEPLHGATVPAGGYLLQARGTSATSWLSGLSAGTKISVAATTKTDARSPFLQALGVGLEIVSQPGVAMSGFSCDSANTTQPARTAIGWTDGGKTMVIAIVSDHPHTSSHGLDEDQMSKLMAQLGVSQAWALDGSGSTEMLVKYRNASSLTMLNYPSDGAERPMPVGLGISVKPRR